MEAGTSGHSLLKSVQPLKNACEIMPYLFSLIVCGSKQARASLGRKTKRKDREICTLS